MLKNPPNPAPFLPQVLMLDATAATVCRWIFRPYMTVHYQSLLLYYCLHLFFVETGFCLDLHSKFTEPWRLIKCRFSILNRAWSDFSEWWFSLKWCVITQEILVSNLYRLNGLDKKRLRILPLPIPCCVSLIMVTITSHIFINIFQTVHFQL